MNAAELVALAAEVLYEALKARDSGSVVNDDTAAAMQSLHADLAAHNAAAKLAQQAKFGSSQ